MGWTIFLIPFFLLGFFILLSGIFTVKQQTAAIVERFGKFLSIRNSGLQFKIPVFDRIAGRINLKIQQLDVMVETKTKDDVFVRLKISVQFQVLRKRFTMLSINLKIRTIKSLPMCLMWFVQKCQK